MDVGQTQETEREHTEDDAIGDLLCPAHRFRLVSCGELRLFFSRKIKLRLFFSRKIKHRWHGGTRRAVCSRGLGCCREITMSIGLLHRVPDLGHMCARHRRLGI